MSKCEDGRSGRFCSFFFFVLGWVWFGVWVGVFVGVFLWGFFCSVVFFWVWGFVLVLVLQSPLRWPCFGTYEVVRIPKASDKSQAGLRGNTDG